MNVFMAEGRLTRDAETGKTSNRTPYLRFSIATNTGFGKFEKTLFVNCILWGQRAETRLVEFLTKGSRVAVSGQLEPDDWTDRSGEKRKGFTLSVYEIALIESKKNSRESGVDDPFGGSPNFPEDHDEETLF